MTAALRAPFVRPPTLVTIRFSHYNERARWALDWHRVPYVEAPYLPLMSSWGVMAHGGWRSGQRDKVSTALSTPLLICADGRRVHDSQAIMEFADAHYASPQTSLFAPQREEIRRLCTHWHDKLGPHTRRIAYHHMLDDDDAFLAACKRNVGGMQYRAFATIWPFVKGYLRRGLAITKERADKSRGYVRKEFDAAAAMLASHSYDFLVGPQFSAADISFASLAAPVLLVQPWEGYGGDLPAVETVDDDFRDLVKELRAHEAGQYAMRMFRHHRGERQIPGMPRLADDPPHHVLTRSDDRGGSGNMGTGVAMRPEQRT